jgi:hypothetical protein
MRAIFHASTSAVALKLRQAHLHNRVFANSILFTQRSIRGKIMWRRTITFFGFVPESQLGKILTTAFHATVFGRCRKMLILLAQICALSRVVGIPSSYDSKHY